MADDDVPPNEMPADDSTFNRTKSTAKSKYNRSNRVSEHLGKNWRRNLVNDGTVLGGLRKMKEALAKKTDPDQSAGPWRNSICGKFSYYNDFAFRLPIWNLIHPFLSYNTEHLVWSQISVFLINIGIVIGLVLALVCTFYSAVTEADMTSAEVRFGYGKPGQNFTTPWDLNQCESIVHNGNTYDVCSRGAFQGTVDINGTKQSGTCEYPCFQPRAIDPDGTFMPGTYAEWWYDNGGEGDEAMSIAAQFSYSCIVSTCFLTSALLATVLILAVSPTNTFLDETNVYSFSNAAVLRTYTFWIKLLILFILFLTVFGTLFFFDAIKYVVYVKYTDKYIEKHGTDPGFLSLDAESTYTYVTSVLYLVLYLPMIIMLLCLSKGFHSVYCYPFTPYGSRFRVAGTKAYYLLRSCVPETEKDAPYDPQAYRLRQVTILSEFLRKEVGLPSTHMTIAGGPRSLAYDVFLSTAGGLDATEAEIIANSLIDVHIDSKQALLRIVADEDTKGWLGEIPGISKGAATILISRLEKIAAKKDAKKGDSSYAGFDEPDTTESK